MAIDLPTLATIIGLVVAVVGLALAIIPLWMRVKELEEGKRQFQEYIAELRKLSKSGEVVGRTLQADQTQAMTFSSRNQQLQEQVLQHQRLMDYAKLAIAIWDRVKSSDDSDDEDEEEGE